MARTCYYLSSAELATALGAGKVLVSGPHATEAICLAACAGDSGSGGGGGGGPIVTTCCPDGLATTLHVLFHQISGACPLLDGVTVALAWDVGHNWWEGTSLCNGGGTVDVKVACDGDSGCSHLVLLAVTSGAVCNVQAAGSPSSGGISGSCSCSPLSLTWLCQVVSSPSGSSCCTSDGTGGLVLTATLTE